jgi:DNA-binding CsgD family transcriptional regulator
MVRLPSDPPAPGLAEVLGPSVFRASLVPMLVADDDRRYLAANRACCLLFRLPEHEVIRLCHDDLVAPERRAQVRNRWELFLKQGTLTGTSELLLPDGTLLSVDFGGVANLAPGRHLSVFLPVGWDKEAVANASTRPVPSEITEREREILRLVAMGEPVEEIAARLFLSPHTVRTHIRNARLKLGANSRAHAIALAFGAGLFSPPG